MNKLGLDHQMTIPHVSAAEFTERLTSLAQRLATKRIVVSKLNCMWTWAQSWELYAQQNDATERFLEELKGPFPMAATGADVLKCGWWGYPEQTLMIDKSPANALGPTNEWTRLHSSKFDNMESALAFAEAFLTDRLGS